MILSLSCQVGWVLNGRLVVQALTLCLGLYSSAGSSNGTKAAAQATCTQTLAEFCRDLGKARESDDPDNRYNDAIPVFQFVSSRMEDVLKNASENGAELPLLLQGGPTEFYTKSMCHVLKNLKTSPTG